MNLMLRRRAMMGIAGDDIVLPDGFTRLQYIYNTSNAYIDTGISVGNTDEIDCFWQNVNPTSEDNAVWGARDNNSMYCFLNRYSTSTQVYFRWGGKSSGNYDDTIGRVLVEDNIWYIYQADGVTVRNTWNSNAGTFQMTETITLFAQNDAVTGTYRFPCKGIGLRYFKIAGKFDGIPCINDNNVVGMYDIINQSFKSSPNGTAFVAGPVY